MLQTTLLSAAFSVTCKEGDLGLSSPVGRGHCHGMHPGTSQPSTCCGCRTRPLPQLTNKPKRGICRCAEVLSTQD